ncbi:hypothetical protein ACFWYW_05010 [Nonomuraea sp. NPDC059023]|uniref:hypothetical protein n=1 Tax=unclassified Nonomuraea TaxID=2593643 RepID=UPI0036C07F90
MTAIEKVLVAIATALRPPARAFAWWHRQLTHHPLVTLVASGAAFFSLYVTAAWITGERPMPWAVAGFLAAGMTAAAGLRSLIITWRRVPIEPPGSDGFRLRRVLEHPSQPEHQRDHHGG